MKKAITTIIAAVISMTAISAVHAGDDSSEPQPPAAGSGYSTGVRQHQRPPTAQEELSRLKQTLGLTQDQCANVLAILQNEEQQRQAIMSADAVSRDAQRKKLGQLMKLTRSKIRALLTDDQKTKFDAMRGPGGPGGGQSGRSNRPPPDEGSSSSSDEPPPPPPDNG